MDFRPSKKIHYSILLLLCTVFSTVVAGAVDFQSLDRIKPEVSRKPTINDYNLAFAGMTRLLASRINLK